MDERLLSLPRSLSSPATARGAVRDVLGRAGTDEDCISTAQVVVSELVTNAVVHARSDVDLVLRVDGPRLRVEVADHGGGRPAVLHPPPDADRGRGLLLVESLAERWGVRHDDHSKVVWAELPLAGRPGRGRRGGGSGSQSAVSAA